MYSWKSSMKTLGLNLHFNCGSLVLFLIAFVSMNYLFRKSDIKLIFKVNFAQRKRYKNSTIPSMQRMLNNDELLKKKRLRTFGCWFIYVPANYSQFISVSLSLWNLYPLIDWLIEVNIINSKFRYQILIQYNHSYICICKITRICWIQRNEDSHLARVSAVTALSKTNSLHLHDH